MSKLNLICLYAQNSTGYSVHLQVVFKYIPKDLNDQTDLEVISCASPFIQKTTGGVINQVWSLVSLLFSISKWPLQRQRTALLGECCCAITGWGSFKAARRLCAPRATGRAGEVIATCGFFVKHVRFYKMCKKKYSRRSSVFSLEAQSSNWLAPVIRELWPVAMTAALPYKVMRNVRHQRRKRPSI